VKSYGFLFLIFIGIGFWIFGTWWILESSEDYPYRILNHYTGNPCVLVECGVWNPMIRNISFLIASGLLFLTCMDENAVEDQKIEVNVTFEVQVLDSLTTMLPQPNTNVYMKVQKVRNGGSGPNDSIITMKTSDQNGWGVLYFGYNLNNTGEWINMSAKLTPFTADTAPGSPGSKSDAVWIQIQYTEAKAQSNNGIANMTKTGFLYKPVLRTTVQCKK
jgi:hypothetical protein